MLFTQSSLLYFHALRVEWILSSATQSFPVESYSRSVKFIEDQIRRITLCVIPPPRLHLAFGIVELCQDELVDL